MYIKKINFKRLGLWLAILGGVGLLIHNAYYYDYHGGYDARAHMDYAKVISSEWRFPQKTETHQNYNPPLFYIITGLISRFASAVTSQDFYTSLNAFKPFGILLAIGYLFLWFSIFRHLFPKNNLLQAFFIIWLFSLPVFHKVAVMFNTEIMLSFIVAFTIWYFVIKFQPKPTFLKTVTLALLASIALLIRMPALSLLVSLMVGILGLSLVRKLNFKKSFSFLLIFLVIITVFTSWFYYGRRQEGIYQVGRNFEPDLPLYKRQPAAFYFDIPFRLMMTYPIRLTPNTPLNRLIPIYYSDFWGDWWNYFSQRRYGISVKARRQNHYLTSPQRVANLALQNQVNLPSTLLIIAGFFYLVLKLLKDLISRKLNQRWLIEAVFITITASTWIGFLIMITKYPHYIPSGVKASYMLSIVPIFIYAAVVFISDIISKLKILFLPVMIWLIIATGVNFYFNWY